MDGAFDGMHVDSFSTRDVICTFHLVLVVVTAPKRTIGATGFCIVVHVTIIEFGNSFNDKRARMGVLSENTDGMVVDISSNGLKIIFCNDIIDKRARMGVLLEKTNGMMVDISNGIFIIFCNDIGTFIFYKNQYYFTILPY